MNIARFDDDIDAFNTIQDSAIKDFRNNKLSYEELHQTFDEFIRPKLRSFFRGGLTRRIDAVVPFFKFTEDEAHVVADMFLDSIRMTYALPPTTDRKVQYHFHVTDYAVSELSKGYNAHKQDGASAIQREINLKVIKPIHMQWVRHDVSTNNEDSVPVTTTADRPAWVHYDPMNGIMFLSESPSVEQLSTPPYFVGNEAEDAAGTEYLIRRQGSTNGVVDSESWSSDREVVAAGIQTLEQELADVEAWVDPYAYASRESQDNFVPAKMAPKVKAQVEETIPRVEEGVTETEIVDASRNEVSTLPSDTGMRSFSSMSDWEEERDHPYLENVVDDVGGEAWFEGALDAQPLRGDDNEDEDNSASEIAEAGGEMWFFDQSGSGEEGEGESQIRHEISGDLSTNEIVKETVIEKNDMQEIDEPSYYSVNVYFVNDFQSITFNNVSNSQSVSDVMRRIASELLLLGSEFRCWVKLADEGMHIEHPMNTTSMNGRYVTIDLTDIDDCWLFCRNPSEITIEEVARWKDSFVDKDFEESWSGTSLPTGQGKQNNAIDILVERKIGRKWQREESLSKWRNLLLEGDVVDMQMPSTGEWREAKIRQIDVMTSSRHDPLIYAHFLGMPSTSDFSLLGSSPAMQPLYTRSVNWRAGLTIGSTVDVRIAGDNWVKGTVVEVDEENEELVVEIKPAKETLRKRVSWLGEDICERFTHTPLKSAVLRHNSKYFLENNAISTVVHSVLRSADISFAYDDGPSTLAHGNVNCTVTVIPDTDIDESDDDDGEEEPSTTPTTLKFTLSSTEKLSEVLPAYSSIGYRWWAGTESQGDGNTLDSNLLQLFDGKKKRSNHLTVDVTDVLDDKIYCRNPSRIRINDISVVHTAMDGTKYRLARLYLERNKWGDIVNMWRRKICKGDMLDVFSEASGTWHEAIVLAFDPYSDYKNYKIAFERDRFNSRFVKYSDIDADVAIEKMRRDGREPVPPKDGPSTATIHFLGWSAENDTRLLTTSDYLQPLYTHTVNWRAGLTIDSIVDVRTVGDNWVKGTVVEVDEENEELVVEIKPAKDTLRKRVSWLGEDICERFTHVSEAESLLQDDATDNTALSSIFSFTSMMLGNMIDNNEESEEESLIEAEERVRKFLSGEDNRIGNDLDELWEGAQAPLAPEGDEAYST